MSRIQNNTFKPPFCLQGAEDVLGERLLVDGEDEPYEDPYAEQADLH